MNTVSQTLSILVAIASAAAAPACTPSTAASEPASQAGAPSAPPPGPVPATHNTTTKPAKTAVPVDVALTSSATSGTIVLTLRITPQADIPNAVARIVLPKEVKLVSGQPEANLGPLQRGVVRQHQITVAVPDTVAVQIFAGVDCQISSGILLHKGAQALVLGPQ